MESPLKWWRGRQGDPGSLIRWAGVGSLCRGDHAGPVEGRVEESATGSSLRGPVIDVSSAL